MSDHRIALAKLLVGFAPQASIPDVEVSHITLDSREVQPGSLFIALNGGQVDARKLIEQAIDNGAVAALHDSDDPALSDLVVLDRDEVLVIKQLRTALSEIAARFYDHPSHDLTVIGITGTNGKTTVAYLLAQMFDQLGYTAAIIGTLGKGRVGSIESTGMTTLDAVQTQAALAEMRDSGVDIVSMEVSSHGLELGRVSAVKFRHVILTNLSQDHLDFHLTMQRYAAVKARLFDEFDYQVAIINHDDDFGKGLTARLKGEVLDYGLSGGLLKADQLELTTLGIEFCLHFDDKPYRVSSPLIGEFNVYNLLAVMATGLALGHAPEALIDAVGQCDAVPGRMQRVSYAPEQPVVVVDYAHTPDALEKALRACRAHCNKALIVVFGCGGDRDQTKRPLMGRIAEKAADQVFITDDNPRGEQPEQIVNDIVDGMHDPAWVIHDRAQAISTAIAQAGNNDWVLIAGKGHETSQQYETHAIKADDRLIAQDALERLAA